MHVKCDKILHWPSNIATLNLYSRLGLTDYKNTGRDYICRERIHAIKCVAKNLLFWVEMNSWEQGKSSRGANFKFIENKNWFFYIGSMLNLFEWWYKGGLFFQMLVYSSSVWI